MGVLVPSVYMFIMCLKYVYWVVCLKYVYWHKLCGICVAHVSEIQPAPKSDFQLHIGLTFPIQRTMWAAGLVG